VRAVFQTNEYLQGYPGILHGGVVASLLDAAMTHCLFHKGVKALTAELKIRYKHAIPSGEQVVVQAQLIKCRPPLYHLKARLLLGSRTMACSEARFMRMQDEETAEMKREKIDV
jgi:acyl-coenzyme A thioesterase PaaI-like protein